MSSLHAHVSRSFILTPSGCATALLAVVVTVNSLIYVAFGPCILQRVMDLSGECRAATSFLEGFGHTCCRPTPDRSSGPVFQIFQTDFRSAGVALGRTIVTTSEV